MNENGLFLCVFKMQIGTFYAQASDRVKIKPRNPRKSAKGTFIYTHSDRAHGISKLSVKNPKIL